MGALPHRVVMRIKRICVECLKLRTSYNEFDVFAIGLAVGTK